MQQRDPRKEQGGQGQGKPGQNQPQQNPGQRREMEEESMTDEFKCQCGETFESQEELEEHEANCSSN